VWQLAQVNALLASQKPMHSCLPTLAVLPCSLWILGAAGCALAPSFAVLLPCRLLVGAACGPFIALAAPLIDDLAPPPKKSLWLALLFVCIPTGFAVGFLFGGLVSHCHCSVSALCGRGSAHGVHVYNRT
jgi:MFS family permease